MSATRVRIQFVSVHAPTHHTLVATAEGHLQAPEVLAKQKVVVQVAAASMMWLVGDCQPRSKAVVSDMVAMMAFPELRSSLALGGVALTQSLTASSPADVVRYAALGLWCLMHDESMRKAAMSRKAGVLIRR